MQEVSTQRRIDEVLLDIEQVLQEERTALLCLDATSIDAFNQKKADLESELSGYKGKFSPSHESHLQQLKLQLRNNLILLIHARNHIQARLGIEHPPVVARSTSKPVVGGTRLNLRG